MCERTNRKGVLSLPFQKEKGRSKSNRDFENPSLEAQRTRPNFRKGFNVAFFSGTFFAVSPAIWKTNGGNGHYQTRGIYLKTPGSIDGQEQVFGTYE